MAEKKALNTYQRIKRAAMKGTGLHLSPQEAWDLYFCDVAVKFVADDSDGWVGLPTATCGSYEDQRARATPQRGIERTEEGD